jgi:hypothetical protein
MDPNGAALRATRERTAARVARTAAHVIGGAAVCVSALVVLAWLAGRIASDRWWWSQWLLWIPTPAAAAALLLALLAQAGMRLPRGARRRLRAGLAAALLACAGHVAAIEHKLWRGGPEAASGLRLLHWNINHTTEGLDDRYAEAIAARSADLMVISNAAARHRAALAPRLAGRFGEPRIIGSFTVYSTLAVREARVLVYSEGCVVALVRLDGAAVDRGEAVVYLVDLPSPPQTPRMVQSRRVRALLDGLNPPPPPPDIVIGDFNMTRGSAALQALFPSLHHAADEAGRGIHATFHRAFPLYHIDHVLLSTGWSAIDYATPDPGVGRHRMQEAVVSRP